MRKIYLKNWLGVNFQDLTALDADRIADGLFYDRFYQELFRRYTTYE
jgi:hypothetical protein